jgi:hypothetical protein
MLMYNYRGASASSQAICTRYLAGILDLPGFWQDHGSVHSDVARKLCSEIIRMLKDIGVDILTLGPINEPESPFDYDSVDVLITCMLHGLSGWFKKLDPREWTLQPWYKSMREMVQLLRK